MGFGVSLGAGGVLLFFMVLCFCSFAFFFKSRFFTLLLGSENYFILMNYVLLCKLWNEWIYMKSRDSVFFVS